METLFMNSSDEFEQFIRLIKDFESGMNVNSEIKSKYVKNVEKMAKNDLHQQHFNQLYEKMLQEFQQK